MKDYILLSHLRKKRSYKKWNPHLKLNVSKVRPGKCDFRANRDKPIGTLVDQFGTDHKNPQFIVMMDLRDFLFHILNLYLRSYL